MPKASVRWFVPITAFDRHQNLLKPELAGGASDQNPDTGDSKINTSSTRMNVWEQEDPAWDHKGTYAARSSGQRKPW